MKRKAFIMILAGLFLLGGIAYAESTDVGSEQPVSDQKSQLSDMESKAAPGEIAGAKEVAPGSEKTKANVAAEKISENVAGKDAETVSPEKKAEAYSEE